MKSQVEMIDLLGSSILDERFNQRLSQGNIGGNMERKEINVCGMPLEEWRNKSCIAQIASDKDWATVYSIESKEEGKGHATELLLEAKKYYEAQNKKFGGSVALNPRMSALYKKCGVEEYI